MLDRYHEFVRSSKKLLAPLGQPPSIFAKYELGEHRLDLLETLQLLSVLEADSDAFLEAIRQKLAATGETKVP